jgi:hypothetical protein
MSKIRTFVGELTDRRPSSYVLEGSLESGLPLHLDAPSLYRLPNKSIMIVDGKRIPIQYIFNCDTIIAKEQKEQGIDPNPLHSGIYFENGVLSVVGEGINESLYEYLKKCEWNESNPDRPKQAKTVFREVVKEKEAEESLQDIDELADSMVVLKGLRSKGTKGYEYDLERINALLALFNFQAGESPQEKLQALVATAQSRPGYFMERVNSGLATTRVKVMQAREFGVIVFGDHLSEKSTGMNLFKFRSKDGDKRIDEAVMYYLNPDNKDSFARLVIELEAAQRLALEAKN